jgi:hypothetical protein
LIFNGTGFLAVWREHRRRPARKRNFFEKSSSATEKAPKPGQITDQLSHEIKDQTWAIFPRISLHLVDGKLPLPARAITSMFIINSIALYSA